MSNLDITTYIIEISNDDFHDIDREYERLIQVNDVLGKPLTWFVVTNSKLCPHCVCENIFERIASAYQILNVIGQRNINT